MSDFEKKITIPVELDTTKAEKEVKDVKEKAEKTPIKLQPNIDTANLERSLDRILGHLNRISKAFNFKKADTDKAGKAFTGIEDVLISLEQHLSNVSNDIKNIGNQKISMPGLENAINNLGKSFEKVRKNVNSLTEAMKFNNVRPPHIITEEIDNLNSQYEALNKNVDKYNKTQKSLSGQTKKTTAKEAVQAYYDPNLRIDVEDTEKLLKKIKEFRSAGGSLDEVSYSFNIIKDDAENATREVESLRDVLIALKDVTTFEMIEGDEIKKGKNYNQGLTDLIDDILKLDKATPTIKGVEEELGKLNKEKEISDTKFSNQIKVQIDDSSIQELGNNIKEVVSEINILKDQKIGFSEEDVTRIESAFRGLENTIKEIHNLLNTFDIPKIDMSKTNDEVQETARLIKNLKERARYSLSHAGKDMTLIDFNNLETKIEGIIKEINDLGGNAENVASKFKEFKDSVNIIGSDTPESMAKSESAIRGMVEGLEKEQAEAKETQAAIEKLKQAEREQTTNATNVQNIAAERDSIGLLINLLNEVVNKIHEKNGAMVLSANTTEEQVMREYKALSLLQDVLSKIKTLFENLGTSNVKMPQFTNVSNFSKSIEGVIKALDANDLDKMQKSLKSFSDTMADFAQEINKINIDDNSFFQQMNNLLDHSKELDKIAKVLKNTKDVAKTSQKVDSEKATTKEKDAKSKQGKQLGSELIDLYESKIKLQKDRDKAMMDNKENLVKALNKEIAAEEEKIKAKKEQIQLLGKEYEEHLQVAKIEEMEAAYERDKSLSVAKNVDKAMKNIDNVRQNAQSFIEANSSKGSKYEGYEEQLKLLYNAREQAKALIDQLKQAGDAESVGKINVDLKEIEQNIKTIEAGAKAISSDSMNKTLEGTSKIQTLMKEISTFMNDNTAMGRGYRNQFEGILESVKQLRTASNSTEEDIEKLRAQFRGLASEVEYLGKTGPNMMNRLGNAMKTKLAQQAAMYLSLQDFIRYFRTAFNTIKELDYALVDLRKTTTMSASDLNQFYLDANESAKQYGVTTKEIIDQAAQWSRLNKIGPLYSNI